MTATQVFLRFIESEYMNADGSVNTRKLKLWRNELRYNGISSKHVPNTVRKRCRASKNYVDDFLYRHRYTLAGFIRHYFWSRANWCYDYIYGYCPTKAEDCLSRKWKYFLAKHINEYGDFKKYWTKDKKFNFSWKD